MTCRAALVALTLCMATPAAADTVTSRANDPSAAMAGVAALFGAERAALAALPAEALAPTRPARAARAERKPRRGKAGPMRYELDWLMAQPAGPGGRDAACLATAIYFEARGETLAGQFAVAEVILNRVDSPRYPGSVCAVVGQRNAGGCQFSYACDGRADAMRDPSARAVAERIAGVMLAGAPRALTQGATHFHTRAVRPGWAARFPRTAAIGAHLFYRQPGALPAGLAAN
jgi:spore germination cell wall hydrolase CwlJ-like protein